MSEFFKALSEFVPEKSSLIEFRVYYREDGSIIGYTTESWPGDYITVDKLIFHENRFDLRVKDGKLYQPKNSIGKLRPDKEGTPCHPADITIIIDDVRIAQHWKIHTYED